MDIVSKEVRSRIMASVRQKNTGPERIVRSLLHHMGFRFRLHPKKLPGTPDIVLPRYKMAIFVHGCFWHQHKDCPKAKRPTSNREYWEQKLDQNIERDNARIAALQHATWSVLVVWECETKDPDALAERLKRSLSSELQVRSQRE